MLGRGESIKSDYTISLHPSTFFNIIQIFPIQKSRGEEIWKGMEKKELYLT
jgi:hypothetical protein